MRFVQRHTISQGKPCIANIRKEIKEDAMQRYTIFDRKTCIANMNNSRRPCTVQRHTISGEKKLCREHGEEEKNEPKPHHTAQHDTIIPQNHNTSYHIISHHITTISKPDNTTNRQNPIPCLKHHTLQHYTTKALPPKKPEEELY